MKLPAIVSTLRSLGAGLHALDGGRLGVRPRTVLTDALRSEIRSHRDEILDFLRREGARADSPAARLDRAWAAAFERARGGFTRDGKSPGAEVLTAAAKLELDLADPDAVLPIGTTPDLLRELLDAVYAGRLEAKLLESGAVLIRCRHVAATTSRTRP